ncbi:hypothetical protein BJ546DRAFT_258546 [Cryomyces antarcticus]
MPSRMSAFPSAQSYYECSLHLDARGRAGSLVETHPELCSPHSRAWSLSETVLDLQAKHPAFYTCSCKSLTKWCLGLTRVSITQRRFSWSKSSYTASWVLHCVKARGLWTRAEHVLDAMYHVSRGAPVGVIRKRSSSSCSMSGTKVGTNATFKTWTDARLSLHTLRNVYTRVRPQPDRSCHERRGTAPACKICGSSTVSMFPITATCCE